MASITWPTTLPPPEQDGYGETPPDTTIRTEMDSGPVKVRRRNTAGSRPFALKYRLTKTQVEILDEFFLTTTRSGSLRFIWINPRTGALCLARFKAAPQYAPAEFEAYASVTLEVLP